MVPQSNASLNLQSVSFDNTIYVQFKQTITFTLYKVNGTNKIKNMVRNLNSCNGALGLTDYREMICNGRLFQIHYNSTSGIELICIDVICIVH